MLPKVTLNSTMMIFAVFYENQAFKNSCNRNFQNIK